MIVRQGEWRQTIVGKENIVSRQALAQKASMVRLTVYGKWLL